MNKNGNIRKLGWDNPKLTKLWRYNLHYFDDLNAEDNQKQIHWHIRLMTEWVAKNKPGYGSGWEHIPHHCALLIG